MKKILTFVLMAASVAAGAQNIQRYGVNVTAGKAEISIPQTEITVSLQVRTSVFTPGVYARYAQKMLGVRASLADKKSADIVNVLISDRGEVLAPAAEPLKTREEIIPVSRNDSRILTLEMQAQATADMIFSLRKHRLDLVTGESGENVFGAGLGDALKEIERQLSECEQMFFGRTEQTLKVYNFKVTPRRGVDNYTVCRFKADAGVTEITDLSGEALMLHIDKGELPQLDGIARCTPQTKGAAAFSVAASCRCSLLRGVEVLGAETLPLLQMGERIYVMVPLK